MRRLQVQVLSRGPFHTETKADQIRRRLEAGWIAVHAVIVGRDHWPPQFYPRSSAVEPPASNRQVEGAIPSGDATPFLQWPNSRGIRLKTGELQVRILSGGPRERQPAKRAGTRC